MSFGLVRLLGWSDSERSSSLCYCWIPLGSISVCSYLMKTLDYSKVSKRIPTIWIVLIRPTSHINSIWTSRRPILKLSATLNDPRVNICISETIHCNIYCSQRIQWSWKYVTNKGNIIFVAVPSLIPAIQPIALLSLDLQFLVFRNIGWPIRVIKTLGLSSLCVFLLLNWFIVHPKTDPIFVFYSSTVKRCL